MRGVDCADGLDFNEENLLNNDVRNVLSNDDIVIENHETPLLLMLYAGLRQLVSQRAFVHLFKEAAAQRRPDLKRTTDHSLRERVEPDLRFGILFLLVHEPQLSIWVHLRHLRQNFFHPAYFAISL